MPKSKVCTKCKQNKLFSEFYKCVTKKDGLNSWCKNCSREYCKQWYSKQDRRRELNFRRYGLDGKKYDQMVEEQRGLCAICGKSEISRQQPSNVILNLSVDHNHLTKNVRGLLCQKCNHALGLLKVDEFGILNLQLAISYLINNK